MTLANTKNARPLVQSVATFTGVEITITATSNDTITASRTTSRFAITSFFIIQYEPATLVTIRHVLSSLFDSFPFQLLTAFFIAPGAQVDSILDLAGGTLTRTVITFALPAFPR